MAILEAYGTSQNSGQAVFSDLSTVNYARTIYLTVNGTPSGTQSTSYTIAGGDTPASSYVADYTGLLPATTYTVNCTVYRSSPWEVVYSNSVSFTTLSPPVQPWDWYTSKTSGGSFNLTPTEWLDFCERINQMRVARSLSAYPFTTSSTYIGSDKPFYAWIFKEAVNALDGFWGLADELKTVQSGDDIYAWYFTNLKSCLNQAISEIP